MSKRYASKLGTAAWIKAAKRPFARAAGVIGRAAANRRETPEAWSDASVASNGCIQGPRVRE